MAKDVKTLSGLLGFINSDFECAYEVILLYIAVKFKDDEGCVDTERFVDFFIELFLNLKNEGIVPDKSCNPLQGGDREEVRSLLISKPIDALISGGLFSTEERFNFELFKEIFKNEEAILVALKERLISYFLGRGTDSHNKLDTILSNWEETMNQMIKTNALMRITEGYSKFTLEFLLKFLYQSYSLGAFEKLVSDHQINQKELIDYFNYRLKFPLTRVGGPPISSTFERKVAMKTDEDPESQEKSAEEHLRNLTEFFHNIREESLDDKKEMKKKKQEK